MTLRIAVCDDEKDALLFLKRTVANIVPKYEKDFEIVTFDNADDLIRYCRKNLTDIILMDIDMPEINGFDAIETIKKFQSDIATVFITAHEELAYQAYDYQPFWFISKKNLEKLDNVLDKLIKKLRYRKISGSTVCLDLNPIVSVSVKDVAYLKSGGHYLTAYDNDNNVIMKFRCSIKYAYDRLSPYGFIHAQRSYIVNSRYIKRFSSKDIVLKNEHKITVTRSAKKLKEARELYGKFMRNTRW